MSVFRAKLTPSNYIAYGTIRLLAATAILLLVALGLHNLYFGELSKNPTVKATVTGNVKHVIGEGTDSEETIYTPVLVYTIDGETYTAQQGLKAASGPYQIGKKVEIQYDPVRPERTYQLTQSRTWAAFTVVSTIGLAGLLLLVRTTRQILAIRRGLGPFRI
jgi:hypothetical protein